MELPTLPGSERWQPVQHGFDITIGAICRLMMETPGQLKSDAATIRVCAEGYADPPVVVHRETLLADLPDRGNNQYVLISGDEQTIIGVVPVTEIDRRLLSSNQFERTRWASMPIGAMSKLSFSDTTVDGPVLDQQEISCSAIRQGDCLFGLSVEGDLFFSWKRLESLFAAALSDPLTGLMNRLAYERRLQEEWSRSLRTNTSISVVVVDLDDFKAINDTHGHVVGDQVLIEVSRKLEASMRSYDVVARLGGDEFVALCLGCAPDDIEIPITRVMDSLAEIEMEVDGAPLTVEASIGAAVRHCDFADNPPEDLFVAADSCLYESKGAIQNAWKIEFGAGVTNQPSPVRRRVFDEFPDAAVAEI